MTPPIPPWWIRLSLDVDPSGNPIGRSATLFENGQEKGCLFLAFPGPFDDLNDAWSDLVTDFTNYIGEQQVLF